MCAPTPIHPLICSAQGTSETSENKCADIQKVNNGLHKTSFHGNYNVPVPIIVGHVCVYVWLWYGAIQWSTLTSDSFSQKNTWVSRMHDHNYVILYTEYSFCVEITL